MCAALKIKAQKPLDPIQQILYLVTLSEQGAATLCKFAGAEKRTRPLGIFPQAQNNQALTGTSGRTYQSISEYAIPYKSLD